MASKGVMIVPADDESVSNEVVQSYRPIQRPAMARLTIYDDGCSDGEVIRLREDRTTIGRDRAIVRIPHDPLIDPCHFSIERQWIDDEWRWVLTDLDSQTGLWIRVRKTKLRDESQFMVGRNRYLFREASAHTDSRAQLEARLADGSLPGWDISSEGETQERRVSCLEKLSNAIAKSGEMATYLIDGDFMDWSLSRMCRQRASDTFLAAKHVRIYRDEQWCAETQGAPNGLWIRMERLVVQESCAFQIGEQRFHLSCRWNDD